MFNYSLALVVHRVVTRRSKIGSGSLSTGAKSTRERGGENVGHK